MRRSRAVAGAGLLVLLGAALGGADAAEKLSVFVSIAPQAYIVERVGSPHVTVGVLVQTGQDPHTFEPTPRQVMALGRAVVYFKLGLPFEERVLGKLRSVGAGPAVVDMTRGIVRRAMGEGEAAAEPDTHEEGGAAGRGSGSGTGPLPPGEERPTGEASLPGAAEGEDKRREGESPEGEHEAHAGEPDPHVWLSPALLKTMAGNAARALQAADPAHAADYEANAAALAADLDALDQRIAGLLAPYGGQSFYVFHPAFGYFGDAYGLKQEAVEVGGKSPTPKQLGELIHRARAAGVRIIFVQPQFDSKAVQAVAEAIDGAVVPISL